jgi:hypothetical protein
MKVFSKENAPYWLGAVVILFVMCFVLLYFSEAQIPTIFTSSGIVAIISAVIGVVLTAFAISIQLKQQSNAVSQKDKDVKIFEQKINVYSEFTQTMWEIIEKNANSVADNVDVADNAIYDLLKKLREICFKRLIFFLDNDQIEKIAKQIAKINEDRAPTKAASEITQILQESLNHKNNKGRKNRETSPLLVLYNSFHKEKKTETEDLKHVIKPKANTQESDFLVKNITYWHFNMFEESQINAFKKGNWFLTLIEYDEEWRTNLLEQVKIGDVIFLFQRGGDGYIGAFKAIGKKILCAEEKNEQDINKYDIYHGLEDGATLCSNIIVEPIAYNYLGVGCKTPRRRTIERINDADAIKFLLNRFNGNDLDEEELLGKDKLDETTSILDKLDTDYFKQIIKHKKL